MAYGSRNDSLKQLQKQELRMIKSPCLIADNVQADSELPWKGISHTFVYAIVKQHTKNSGKGLVAYYTSLLQSSAKIIAPL
ncbi:hypothetical protein TNCV_5118131 [Trichonephila clavipes]|nr:hypothetical protein TNCV_5118131 [Trichonephila clavipes]